MGCTVRDKHIRVNRRVRSAKPDVNHGSFVDNTAKTKIESGIRPYQLDVQDSCLNLDLNGPNPNSQTPDLDGFNLGYNTEEQLEEVLLKNLEFIYNEAISKLITLGYDEDVALEALLRCKHCYGGMDVLSSILHSALAYLNSGSCSSTGTAEESELVFTDLRQLQEYTLAGMVCLLRRYRPHLSKADALWCLLMSELHVGRASTIDIPMLPSPSNVPLYSMNTVESVGNNATNSAVAEGDASGFCRFHGGWGFGNRGTSELPVNGFGGFISYAPEGNLQKEIDCPKRFNLTPSMKSLLKKNVAAFAAGFRANSKQLQTQPQTQPPACMNSALSGDSSKGAVSPTDMSAEKQSEEAHDSKNQDVVNSVLSKFQNLKLDENLESVTEDQKDEILLTLMHQVKDLEIQSRERREWAQQKAMQAARKLSQDLTELKILRMEREETQHFKKGKQTLEDATMKRLSDMENALRKASGQVDRANAAVRQLEVENAEIKAEMEASKLSASESAKSCLEVEKREKKCRKRLMAWEKQKTKLQEEIAAEKQKISDMEQQLVTIKLAQKEAKAKWRQEVKAKESAATQVDEERRAKEAAEASNKRKLEALRLQIDIDFQRHKDDLQRLEQELSRLKAAAQSSTLHDSTDAYSRGNSEVFEPQGETIARLLRELDVQDNSTEKEASSDRECLICMKDEVSVVFLPCAHQVICANCGENYGKKGKTTCPCCRVAIEKKIRVYGASS